MNSQIKSCEWRVAGSGWDYGRKEAQKDTKKGRGSWRRTEGGRRVTSVERRGRKLAAKRREKNRGGWRVAGAALDAGLSSFSTLSL